MCTPLRRRRIDRRRQLVPELDLVAVRVLEEDVRLPGTKLAAPQHAPARLLHHLDGNVDVGRIDETKAEMRDAAGAPRTRCPLLEHEHVAAARRLRLDE